jgi:hypothetical protein
LARLKLLISASMIYSLVGDLQADSKAGANCHSIQSSDLRAYCLARAKAEKSYCYRIVAKDKKNNCLAEVTGEPMYCLRIREKDLRNVCRASS